LIWRTPFKGRNRNWLNLAKVKELLKNSAQSLQSPHGT
jgi:hypothetical protein